MKTSMCMGVVLKALDAILLLRAPLELDQNKAKAKRNQECDSLEQVLN